MGSPRLPKTVKESTVQMSIRLPETLADKLRLEAFRRNVSIQSLVAELLGTALHQSKQ
jgi:predicted HicB family RNase H-like nuclease